MRINNISFKQHVVLGKTTIQFTNKDEQESMEKYLDMSISIGNSSANTYTFFIGENGVGKSVLFRTIIDYANSIYGFNMYKEDKYVDFSKWSRLIYENPVNDEDRMSELLHDYHILNTEGSNTFLEGNDAYLIHMSSAINEDNIIGRSKRYYEMNTSSNAKKTQIMILKALRNTSPKHVKELLHFIGKENSTFNVDFNISTPSWSKEQKMFTVKNGLTITSYIQVLSKFIQKTSDIKALSDQDIFTLQKILRTTSFLDYFKTNDKNVEHILNEISNCQLLKTLNELIAKFHYKDIKLMDRFSQQPIGVCVESKEDISPLIDVDIYSLSDEDILLLSILVELGMCDCNIECDGTPIEKMSSGEQMFFRLYSLFGSLSANNKKENIILLYDEPENSLHPKWQQLFPIYFQEIVENIYGIKSSHFIFATHSPLIILKTKQLKGDVNVIKLYKNDQGATESTVIEDIPTYSIEELMMDEFSLEYRSCKEEQEIKQILDKRNDNIECIINSENLRKDIEDLYNEISLGQ